MCEARLGAISNELRQEIRANVVSLIEYLVCMQDCPDLSSVRDYGEAVIWDLQVLLDRLAAPDADANFPP